MPSAMTTTGFLVAAVLSAVTATAHPATADRPELAFSQREGLVLNIFLRQGATAAHLVARGGTRPRVVVAFPAGNSGAELTFAPTAQPVVWRGVGTPAAVLEQDAKGRPLRGISSVLDITTPELRPAHAILSSIRIIRNAQAGQEEPAALRAEPQFRDRTLAWARDRIDGAAGYALRLTVLRGRWQDGRLVAAANGHIRLRLTALTGEVPLTPLDAASLLTPAARPDRDARRKLAFLSYREKSLAGSWRFNTYFGRDTLMSLRLLQPVLRPSASEAGLASVLARLSPEGEAAHEEGIGEFALLARQGQSDAPTFDYGMVDTSLLLLPVLADYLDTPAGRQRGSRFLATPIITLNPETPSGRTGDLVLRNLRWVFQATESFARAPLPTHLIALKPGHPAGQWRDSDDGLGSGRYAYDVNAVLAPAALRAIARLCDRGLLAPYLNQSDQGALCREAQSRARIWQRNAPPLFALRLDQSDARQKIAAYAASLGISAKPAIAAVGPQGLRFHALSLDAQGKAIPVLHSDEGFALLFSEPLADDLALMVEAMMRPFPAGLASSAGLMVANPAFASADLQARFGSGAYHGTVIWSWQQAMLAAGLDRQLSRKDLPPAIRARLVAARAWAGHAMRSTHTLANSELWSWRVSHRTGQPAQIRPVAYGAAAKDADESNAAQLWSTVQLGL